MWAGAWFVPFAVLRRLDRGALYPIATVESRDGMTAIRDFRDTDFDELVAGWHETNRVSYPYVRLHGEHSLEDARQFFRNALLPECRVWVAERGCQPVGLLAMSDSWIRHLAVFPCFQRQGVGTALLQKAREHSPEQLRLYTFQRNNAARAFYERHGFSVVAFGVSPEPEAEPDVQYCWQAAEGNQAIKFASREGKIP